jgi:hypothetical protein
VQRLSATLTLPFPADSRIINWQPRIRAYREQALALSEELTANWQLHGGGLCRDVMESVVWPLFVGTRLPQYRAFDSTSLPVALSMVPLMVQQVVISEAEEAAGAEAAPGNGGQVDLRRSKRKYPDVT